jgi:diadenosine tetraphosphate (Ap4A) HIT family hydrolase
MTYTLPIYDESFPIIERYKRNVDNSIKEKITNWQNNQNVTFKEEDIENNSKINEHYGKKLKGFGVPPDTINNSPFAEISKALNDKNYAQLKKIASTLLYYDDQCIAFLPANSRNTTLLKANPTSYTLGGASGASSHLHVLVIPRKRIYNDIDLIKHMMKVGKKIVCHLSTADNFFKNDIHNSILQPSLLEKHENLELVKGYIDTYYNTDMFKFTDYLPYGFNLHETAAKSLLGENLEDVKAFFQLHPDHSIGYLHMHIIPMKLVSRAGGETYFLNKRNIPVEHVLDYLNGKGISTGGSKKKQQTKPSKQSSKQYVTYNSKKYEVKTGSRGGRYILVNNKKQYI